jgi:RNA polymerase sigma-70 factor (ECF subfamily)
MSTQVAELTPMTLAPLGAAAVFGPEELRTLEKMARAIAGPSMDAEDLLHDALERALRSFDSFAPGSNLFAWMRTIMFRLAVDQTRGRRRRRAHLERERWALVPAETEGAEDALGSTGTPYADLGMEDIRWAMAQLPESLRRIYQLFAIDGLPYHTVGALENLPVATVGTRLLRARRKLRELLSERALRRQAPLPFARPARLAMATAASRQKGRRSCGKSAALAA